MSKQCLNHNLTVSSRTMFFSAQANAMRHDDFTPWMSFVYLLRNVSRLTIFSVLNREYISQFEKASRIEPV